MRLLLLFALLITTVTASSWTYNRCPTVCKCTMQYTPTLDATLRTVHCSNRQLTVFPTSERIPADVQVLRVDGNLISRIEPDVKLYLPDLLLMNMSSNRLSNIPDLFEGVYNCHHLDLSNNRLTQIDSDTFDGLFNLRSLNLSHNRIYAIMPQGLQGLSMLETIDLSSNLLTVIRRNTWSSTKHIKYINLSMNRIELIEYNALQHLRLLQRIDLSHNQINQLSNNTFNGLTQLKSLNLGYNKFEFPPTSALLQVSSSLRKLILNGNPISILTTKMIRNLNKLQHLHLSNMPNLLLIRQNSISNLPQLTSLHINDNKKLAFIDKNFSFSAPVLRHLYLHNNNLSTIQEGVIDNLGGLTQLSLYGNPIRCDANMKWLEKFINTKYITDTNTKLKITEADHIICPSPMENEMKLFRNAKITSNTAMPRIINILPDRVQLMPGASVTLYCRSAGTPRAHILWISPQGYIGNADSRRRLTNNGQTLVIDEVTEEDNGAFTCLSESHIGQTTKTTKLTVHKSPIELNVLKTTPTSITVQWSINHNHIYYQDNQNQLMQLVYRNVQNGTIPSYARTLMSNDNGKHTIDGLETGNEYELCLAMQNEHKVLSTVACVRATPTSTTSAWSNKSHLGGHFDAFTIGVVLALLIVLGLLGILVSKSIYWRKHDHRYIEIPSLSSPFRRRLQKSSSQTPIVAV